MPKLLRDGGIVLDDYLIIPDDDAHCAEGGVCQDCLLRLLAAGMEKWGGLVLENGTIRFQRKAGEIDG